MQHITKLLLLLIVVVGYTRGAPQPSALQSHVATFVIDPATKGKVDVQLEAASVSASCKLEYDTSVVEFVKEKSATKTNWVPANTLITQMNKKYGCIKYELSMFKYEICLGEEIKQISDNGDVYSLGKFEKVVEGASYTQSYNAGSFCDAIHKDRKSVVEFTCANKVSIHSISENAVCQYRVVVGVPEVCGHPQFSGVVNKPETWVLELSETDEGAVICQAYNNGLDAVGTITFQTFTLSISTADYTLANYVVRNKGRKAASSSELIKQQSPASLSIRKRMEIDYARIVAE